MFGARGPLLEGADGGGSGAAPPAPAPAGDPPAPPPAPAPAPASGEITFTPEQQALVNKLVGKAREEGRSAAKATTPAPAQAPTPPSAPEKVTIESLAAQLAETQLRARFDKRAAKRGLDDDAAEDLFELYKAQKPTDDENWFAEREKRLGLKKQSSTSPPSQPSTPIQPVVVTPSAAPISDRGSPAPAQPVGWRLELAQNPLKMSQGARAAMDAELGVEKARRQRIEAAQRVAETTPVRFTNQG